VLCKRSILVGSLGTNDGSRPGALSSSTLGAAVIPPRMSEQPTVHNRSDASTISDLDHDEAASMSAPPLPPWPTPTSASGARRGSSLSTCSASTVLERSFSSKRKRDGDEESVSAFLPMDLVQPCITCFLPGRSIRHAIIELSIHQEVAIWHFTDRVA